MSYIQARLVTLYSLPGVVQYSMVCQMVAQDCRALRGYEAAEVVVLFINSSAFTFAPCLEHATMYIEFDLLARFKLVVTLARPSLMPSMAAEKIRECLYELPCIAIASVW